MLEAAVALELVLGRYVEGVVIAALLIFNAVVGAIQERRPKMRWPCSNSGCTSRPGCCATVSGVRWPPKSSCPATCCTYACAAWRRATSVSSTASSHWISPLSPVGLCRSLPGAVRRPTPLFGALHLQ